MCWIYFCSISETIIMFCLKVGTALVLSSLSTLCYIYIYIYSIYIYIYIYLSWLHVNTKSITHGINYMALT